MMTRDASGTTFTSASARTAMLARKTSASASMPAAAPRRWRRNPSTARNSSTNAQVTNWPVCVAGFFTGTPKSLASTRVACGHSASAEASASTIVHETR